MLDPKFSDYFFTGVQKWTKIQEIRSNVHGAGPPSFENGKTTSKQAQITSNKPQNDPF